MINNLKKYKYFWGIIFFALAAILLVFRHNIGLIIDCGREVYYPQEILNGKILYKDLFNIYAPFAYLFNAFLYRIFGVNLNVLIISGCFCALGIISGIFLLAKTFLNDKFAFGISFLSISVGIIPVHVFNYVFPYAFSMTYGLCSFIFSLLFLVYYINLKSNKFLYISLFLAGLSVLCKYEFLPYLLIYLPVFFKLKTDFYTIFKGLLSFGIIPEICFAFLFANGLSFQDLLNTINIIISMSNTQTLQYFYMHNGVFIHKQSLMAMALTFSILFIPFFVYLIPVIFKSKIKNPIVGLIFTYAGICLMLLFKSGFSFALFMSINVVLLLTAIFNYKKLINNLSLFVVVSSIFLVSLKVFCGVILNSYGIFYLPLIIIAVAVIFKDKFTQTEWDYIGFYVLILSILIGFTFLKFIPTKHIKISTSKGKMYVEEMYETTNILLDFIEKNTKKSDKILIYPEGMMINFLSDRKTDDFYNSFLPLYEETFGVETYIKHFEKNMPEYIIFNSWNSSDYYFSMVCKDYGFDFCEFVQKNYFEKAKVLGNFSYIVFKKK